MPFSTTTSDERIRFCGIPKYFMPERIIHWFEARHGPDIACRLAQTTHEFAHLRKNIPANRQRKIRVASLLHDFFGQAAVHRDHLSTHDFFGHVARPVSGEAGPCPAGDFVRYQALIQLPGEEAFASVAGPERAIAIKSRDLRMQG